MDLDPLAHWGCVHSTATPTSSTKLGLGNILPIDALAMDARTEEGTGGGEKGKVPVRCSPVTFKTPTQHCPAPGGPPVTHILLLQGSRLQEKRSPQPAGRCLLKEETPAGPESRGKTPFAALSLVAQNTFSPYSSSRDVDKQGQSHQVTGQRRPRPRTGEPQGSISPMPRVSCSPSVSLGDTRAFGEPGGQATKAQQPRCRSQSGSKCKASVCRAWGQMGAWGRARPAIVRIVWDFVHGAGNRLG